MASHAPRRELTLVDCFGLGVNGIVGSGIFLLPAVLYRRAGGASPLAWLAVGALCTLVALSFAEAASTTDRSGGPYRYAVDAFGPALGFGVGWISLVSALLGYAAVARGFANHAAVLVGAAGDPFTIGVAVVVLVFGLAFVNVLGIRLSARAGDAVSALKLLGLVVFVLWGAAHVRGAALAAPPAPNPGEPSGLLAAASAGLFACTGFEFVPVPAGETVNPQRAIGIAMVSSLVGAVVLYALVQLVVVGTLPSIGASETPVVDAARGFGGAWAGSAMAAVATLSGFGFCTGSAMVVPRYLETLAQDRFLPRLFERRAARFGTPVPAVLAVGVLVAPLAVLLDFTRLADIASIAVVAQYGTTCASVLGRRRSADQGAAFRLPFGPLVPALGLGGSLAFLAAVESKELVLAGVVLAFGAATGLATRWVRGVAQSS